MLSWSYGRTFLYKYNWSFSLVLVAWTLGLAGGSVMAFFRIENFNGIKTFFKENVSRVFIWKPDMMIFSNVTDCLEIAWKKLFPISSSQVFQQSSWYGIATLLDVDFCTTSTSLLNALTSLHKSWTALWFQESKEPQKNDHKDVLSETEKKVLSANKAF